MLAEHFTGEKVPLTSPPLDEDSLIMLATGWDWPTLQTTPENIVTDIMAYHRVKGEAQNG